MPAGDEKHKIISFFFTNPQKLHEMHRGELRAGE
jgi:hypothetical protein